MSEIAKAVSDIANYGLLPWVNGAARDLALEANRVKLAITEADVGQGFQFVRQQSSNSLLLICFSGRARVEVQHWRHAEIMGPGEAVYVRQGRRISYESVDDSRFGHFGLEWHVASIAPGREGPPGQILHADPVTFRHAYEGICREIAAGHDDEVLAAWLTVAHRIGIRTVAGEASASPLIELRMELSRRLAHAWTISEMADVLRISETSLRRLCLTETGNPPLRMLRDMRMRRAAELLSTTGASVADVAKQVGYESSFAFSKAFRRRYGCTPSQHRRQG